MIKAIFDQTWWQTADRLSFTTLQIWLIDSFQRKFKLAVCKTNICSICMNSDHIISLKIRVFILILFYLAKKNIMWRCFFLWPRHLTNRSGGPGEAEASGVLIADMKEGIWFINVIIIFPMKTKNLDKVKKGKTI